MNPEHKKYILENMGKRSVKEMAGFLGIKEKRVRRLLEEEKLPEKQKESKDRIEPRLRSDTKTSYFNILAIVLLVIIGIAIYSNTFHVPFQFDDELNITTNPYMKELSNLRAIFSFFPTRFITYLSLAINYHFNHTNVLGYHLFNLLVHLCAAIMVWWLTILTLQTPALKGKKISGHSNIIAFFTALVFVSHPIQTQGVTYIVQRTASLATLFYVSSLAFYLKSRLLQHQKEDKSHIRYSYYTLSFIALILAMFSKEMTITLPFMILLYELCFFREEGIDWKHIMPYFTTLLIIPVITAITKSADFKETLVMRESGPDILPSDYLLTQFRVIVTYIRLLFIPVNQNLDYDYSMSKTLFDIPTLSSLILLAVILITAVRIFKSYRLILFGIFWFFLTLLPESSVIPIKDVIFEHRLYLPMVGYAVFLVSAVYYIFENKGIEPTIIILSIAVISYSTLTYNRNIIWKDEFTLWDDTVRKSPNKARPINNRGKVYLNKGNFDQAISDLNKSIENDPKYAIAYYNRGTAYLKKGNFDQAVSDYNKAIELNPKYVDFYNNRGNAYLDKGNFDQAISDLNKAIELNPKDADTYYNRGNAYLNKGDFDQAVSDYNKAIELNPTYTTAYNNRGTAHLNKGNFDQAVSDYNKAMEIDPKDATSYNNRGTAHLNKGNFDQAISDYTKAMELNPKYAAAYYNRGTAYLNKGNFDQAISDYNKAIELNPEYAAAYNNRAMAYFKKQRYTNSWEDVHRLQALGGKVTPEFIEALKKASGREE